MLWAVDCAYYEKDSHMATTVDASNANPQYWEQVLNEHNLSMHRGIGLSRDIKQRKCYSCKYKVSLHQKVCPQCKANLFDGGRNVNLICVGGSADIVRVQEKSLEKRMGRVRPKGKGID